MGASKHRINVNGAVKKSTMTIKVVGFRRMRARLWVAGLFLRVAGWIAGPSTKIEIVYGDGPARSPGMDAEA